MHYVLDTGFFVDSRVYYPGTFPSFWNKMDAAISQDIISSVKEVQNELARYQGHQGHLLNWMKNRKHIFTAPSAAEQDWILKILAVPEFQGLVNNKQILKGHPAADPFVIAKAWAIGGVVVTTEILDAGKSTPRIKIPNVCEHFKIRYMHPEQFMEIEGWKF
ncbi:MAG: DUF4411 family protein [Gammaproteobacteria bacterium]|nr:DUF4411 family protein [Gammaproteobacteria bacterium]